MCSSQFRDIIKTLEMLLFKSFCPTLACTTPGIQEIGERGGWGKWLSARPACPVLVAYMEPKIVLGIFCWEILQAAPTVSIIAASGNGFLARVATSDQHYWTHNEYSRTGCAIVPDVSIKIVRYLKVPPKFNSRGSRHCMLGWWRCELVGCSLGCFWFNCLTTLP